MHYRLSKQIEAEHYDAGVQDFWSLTSSDAEALAAMLFDSGGEQHSGKYLSSKIK
ncbi:hypothetical protein [Vibrio natriegens]|uniref:hypothetical protein n=1 Tax=Vibrio natriegens TaxID=691 RepID=UPI0012DB6D8B|nr:hypothetical protein [Vibrio natriegens]